MQVKATTGNLTLLLPNQLTPGEGPTSVHWVAMPWTDGVPKDINFLVPSQAISIHLAFQVQKGSTRPSSK